MIFETSYETRKSETRKKLLQHVWSKVQSSIAPDDDNFLDRLSTAIAGGRSDAALLEPEISRPKKIDN